MSLRLPKSTLLHLAALGLLAAPGAASAQAAPSPPAALPAAAPPTPAAIVAATTSANGPLIAGVCLLSQETLVSRSKVGMAATARLREIAQEVQANLLAEKSRLEARGKALEAKRATLSPMEQQAQGQALNQRVQALQAEAGQRNQQIDATKTKAYQQVIQQAQPFIAPAYAAHGCGLLFAREAVLTGNLGNDLTSEVLAAFDAKGTPITFDLAPPR